MSSMNSTHLGLEALRRVGLAAPSSRSALPVWWTKAQLVLQVLQVVERSRARGWLRPLAPERAAEDEQGEALVRRRCGAGSSPSACGESGCRARAPSSRGRSARASSKEMKTALHEAAEHLVGEARAARSAPAPRWGCARATPSAPPGPTSSRPRPPPRRAGSAAGGAARRRTTSGKREQPEQELDRAHALEAPRVDRPRRRSPFCGTTRASRPRSVPTKTTSFFGWRVTTSSASAMPGKRWPPVPPPAISTLTPVGSRMPSTAPGLAASSADVCGARLAALDALGGAADRQQQPRGAHQHDQRAAAVGDEGQRQALGGHQRPSPPPCSPTAWKPISEVTPRPR